MVSSTTDNIKTLLNNNHGVWAEITSVNSLLTTQSLSIPFYQRPYRWTERNVLQLLSDVYDSYKSGKKRYRIGSVILHYKEEDGQFKSLDIVDGQQRITTILLALECLYKYAQVASNNVLIHSMKYKDDGTLTIKSNYESIDNWITRKLTREESTTFQTYLGEKCEFVLIIVSKESEAFQMFDSQNGRGKALETYNLLKAYHIRAMELDSQEDKIKSDQGWEHATRYIDANNGSNRIQDLLKQIINQQLYKTRLWCRKENAEDFSTNHIDEFKGITLDKNHSIKYPFQNTLLLQYISRRYLDAVGFMDVIGIKNRMNYGDPS